MNTIEEWRSYLATNRKQFTNDRYFNIRKIRDGEGTPVIISSGFGSPRRHRDGSEWHGWRRIITRRFPRNPIWRVYWNAKHALIRTGFLGD